MGNIGQEFLSHGIDFLFVLNILVEFDVGIFQLLYSALKGLGQRIHMLTQKTDFTLLLPFVLGIKIQLCHPL